MSESVAEVLADAVWRHGVRQVFGQSLPTAFLLAAEARGIRQVCYRTENAGGAMADGFARVTHQPALVAAQNGPAATLLVPPLAEARKASVPVVAVVQDVPVAHRDRNAFQEFDHFGLFHACAKWVRRLDDPVRARDYVRMAFTAAASGRPGPAVLLVPKDVLVRQVPEDATPGSALATHCPLDRPRPAADAVAAAAQLLAGARRPLVIAGGGVHSAQAAPVLAELQERACLPVATTVMGKGAVDESHPLSAGVIGYFMGPRSIGHGLVDWLAGVDVVLLVGTRTNENGTDAWQAYPRDATYLHLDVDPEEVGRNYPAVRLVGDARAGLEDLLARWRDDDLRARRAARNELTRVLGEARLGHAELSTPVATSDRRPIRPERVMAELDRLLTPETIVVADASYSSIWVANNLHAQRAGQRFLTPRGMAGLGWGLPLALGAKVAAPNAPVVCVTGDGGFGHVWSELETAVRERLPVVVVVLNNAVLGYQKHAELRSFAAATSAVELTQVDHAAVARACGATGVRVDSPDVLHKVLVEALDDPGPVVVDVLTDPDAYPPLTDWDDDNIDRGR